MEQMTRRLVNIMDLPPRSAKEELVHRVARALWDAGIAPFENGEQAREVVHEVISEIYKQGCQIEVSFVAPDSKD